MTAAGPDVIRVSSRGVGLHVRRWPNPGAPALVLVHGYPDTSDVWEPVVSRLRESFDVTVYDTRGIGGSGIPRRAAYRLDDYRADLLAVVDAVYPARRVHLVGHDWGSIHSWESVCDAAENHRFATFTSISGPNLDHVGRWLRPRLMGRQGWAGARKVAEQARKSWYIYLFHVPLLPVLTWRLGERRWRRYVHTMLPALSADYPPAALVADCARGLATYRRNIVPRLLRPRRCATAVPVQFIVPTGDFCVSRHLVEGVEEWLTHCENHHIDANHWVQLSHPDEVANLIGRFTAAHPAGQPADRPRDIA